MPELRFSRPVPFSREQMLALVADLHSYPDFVPNCTGMMVTKENAGSLLARMQINFGPISQSYTSRVVIDEKNMSISARATDGPFSFLASRWDFLPRDEGSEIRFEIDFEIANPMIAAIAEPAFAAKQDEILDAFIAEANRRYS